MNPSRLVLGLFDASRGGCDRSLAARLRDLSLSWARFGYQGAVIEGQDVGVILDRAIESRPRVLPADRLRDHLR